MREHNNIDELFKGAIEPFEMAPSDKVWASLNKNLDQAAAKKPARSLKPYLVGLVAVVSTSALLVAYYGSEEKPVAAQKTNIEVVKPATGTTLSSPVQNREVTSPVNESASSLKDNTVSVPEVAHKNNAITQENKQIAEPVKESITASTNQNAVAERSEKSTPEPVVTEKKTVDKKENAEKNSDKSVVLMPYYPSDQQTSSSNTTTSPATTSNKTQEPADVQIKQPVQSNVLYVPNAFTPNGDGLNDIFVPQTTETFKEYKLYIFDRTGNVIFFSDELHRGWDGRSNVNGNETIKEDIYMWRIEIKNSKGEKEHMMGYLTLIK